jgi:N-acetyl-anhydromuramyl-L-alanine amidase AmpD
MEVQTMNNNEISFRSIKPYSMTELRRYNRTTAEEKRKDEIDAYLNDINYKIFTAWTESEVDRVTIELDNNLYDSYKLKKELKELGYEIELHREIDSYTRNLVPVTMVVKFPEQKEA